MVSLLTVFWRVHTFHSGVSAILYIIVLQGLQWHLKLLLGAFIVQTILVYGFHIITMMFRFVTGYTKLR